MNAFFKSHMLIMADDAAHAERTLYLSQLLIYFRTKTAEYCLDSMDWILRSNPAINTSGARESEEQQRYDLLREMLNFRDTFCRKTLLPLNDEGQQPTFASLLEDIVIAERDHSALLGDRVVAMHNAGAWAYLALRDYAKKLDSITKNAFEMVRDESTRTPSSPTPLPQ